MERPTGRRVSREPSWVAREGELNRQESSYEEERRPRRKRERESRKDSSDW
jgi:hypothetical protein